MVGPPTRAEAEPEETAAEITTEKVRSPRPVIKRSEAKGDGDKPQRPTIPIREIDSEEDEGPKLKPKPKLKRPKPAEPAAKEADTQDRDSKVEDDSISVIGVDDIDGGAKLRRPSPPPPQAPWP